MEATIVLPLFLFAMLAFYHMAMTKYAEGVLYEAVSETSEYLAEFAYLSEPNMAIAEAKYREYIDDANLLNKYISNISFTGTRASGEDVVVIAKYDVGIKVPIFNNIKKTKSFSIHQRMYRGESAGNIDGLGDDSEYVYVTENREVYHLRRDCTHLMLSMRATTITNARSTGFTPCEKCGAECKDTVIVTDEGDKYHSTTKCSGLKRTVSRVSKKSLGGIPACERCGE